MTKQTVVIKFVSIYLFFIAKKKIISLFILICQSHCEKNSCHIIKKIPIF